MDPNNSVIKRLYKTVVFNGNTVYAMDPNNSVIKRLYKTVV